MRCGKEDTAVEEGSAGMASSKGGRRKWPPGSVEVKDRYGSSEYLVLGWGLGVERPWSC